MADGWGVGQLHDQAQAGFADALAADASPLDAVILREIVAVQREYVSHGDPGTMWRLLLDAVLRTTESSYGFIGEVDLTESALPRFETRAMRWLGSDGEPVPPHPDIGLLISQVIATGEPLVLPSTVRLGDGAIESGRFGPIDGFLGLPLTSSERLVGVMGVTAPARPYRRELAAALQPLLSACASIVEAIQSTRARDRAMVALEDTAAFLTALFDSAPDGLLVVDEAGTVVRSNPAARSMLGVEPVDRHVIDFVSDRQRRAIEMRLARLVRSGDPLDEPLMIEVVRADGRAFPAETSIAPIRRGGGGHLIAMFRDVTDRIEAQRAVARAAEILDAAPDFIAWGTIDGRLHYLNRGGRRMAGLSRVEPVHERNLADLCPPWAARHLREVVLPAVAEEGTWAGESAVRGADGEEVPVSLAAFTIAGDGHRPYLAVVARDLTDRLAVEEMKDALMSNVSHELRTPLTSIIGYLELMIEGSFGPINDEQAEALDIVLRNGDRLLELINEILQLARLERDRDEPRLPVVLSEVIERVREAVAVRAADAGVELTVDVPDEVLVVAGDPHQLEMAISNLATNGVKFTPEGGRVTLRAFRQDDVAVVEVEDTGIGIPPDDLDRVFDRFFRATNARSRQIQGTGLGLAIVDAVARNHGGTVSIVSEPGRGTTVTLTLSLSGADQVVRGGG